MGADGEEKVSYYAGLDLGPVGEFSALAVVEKHSTPTELGNEPNATYAVRHLARFPPGTPYSVLIEAVRTVFAEPPIARGDLVVDQTAVGRAVFELFRDGRTGASVRGVTVSAGHAAQSDEHGGWLVPKKDLAGVLQVLLQGKRLKVGVSLEHAQTLLSELQHFKLKTVRLDANAAVEWRERPHDDLVLAVAIAVWQAERYFPVGVYILNVPNPDPPRWRWPW